MARVVITGLGLVSSLGIGWQDFWKNLLAGKSGISRVRAFDTSNYDRHYAGEAPLFNPNDFIRSQRVKKMGRSSQLAVVAAKLAVADANLKKHQLKDGHIAVVMGTTMGEPRILEYMDEMFVNDRQEMINGFSPLNYSVNSIPFNIAKDLGLRGDNKLFANACAAGNYSLGYAYDLIKSGNADCALAGAVDSFSRVAFSGFSRLVVMAEKKCQPFDLNRQGMMVGEGAGVLVVEELSAAKKRNAPVYGEILGYGLSCDTHHMTMPSSSSIADCLRKALKLSGVHPGEVDYISAHGTGTVENDKAECEAYHAVFGHLNRKIPMSSIKSMLGHTMGAASALESIACCLAMKYGEIPPTMNLENIDPLCDIDCVPNKSRKHEVKIALNNSQAFGGNNACVVLKKDIS